MTKQNSNCRNVTKTAYLTSKGPIMGSNSLNGQIIQQVFLSLPCEHLIKLFAILPVNEPYLHHHSK